MTLQESAYNLLNILRGGRSTNSEILSLEQIKFNILYYRALILRLDAERRVDLGSFEQVLPVALSLAEPTIAPSGSVFRGSFFAPDDDFPLRLSRSVRALPSILRLKDREAVTYVGEEHGGGSYPFTNAAQVPSQFHSRYTKNYKRAFLLDSHLCIASPSYDLDSVVVHAVFEDPRAAHNFAVEETAQISGEELNESDLWDDATTPFPCSMDLYQRIVQSLLSGEYRVLQRSDNDISLTDSAQ